MAEGFEFSVSVPVEADLSRFRAQLSAELQQAQQTPAIVPVQGGGGAGTALAVRPATATSAAPAPTLAAVTNAAIAQAAAFDPNGWKSLNPGGWDAVNAANQRVTAPSTINAATAQAAEQAGIPAAVGPSGNVAIGAAAARRGGIFGRGIGGLRTFASVYAVREILHAQAAVQQGELEASIAGNLSESTGALLAGVRRGGSGFFGRAAVETMDLLGFANSPAAIERDLLASGAIENSIRGRDDLSLSRQVAAQSRAAAPLGHFAQERIAREFAAGKEVRELQGRASDLRALIGAVPEQASSEQYQLLRARRSQLKEIEGAIADVPAQLAFANQQADIGRDIERRNIGARTAAFLDAGSGLNPSDAEHRTIVRRHQIEVRETALSDRSLLPDVVRGHAAELFAFDRARDRANQFQDTQSASAVRAFEFTAQGRDFDAAQERQLGEYNARMFAARNDLRQMRRVAQEGVAAAGALEAEKNQRDLVASFLLDRNPLSAAIASERDPMRQRVVFQQITDQEQLRSAALRNRTEVTAMEAGGQEKSAQGLEIERRAELEQDAARRAGYSRADQANILQAGLNELTAYQRQLQRMSELGSVSETAAGAYAPSTGGQRGQSEPVVDAIRNLQVSIDQMVTELRALTGGN